MNRFNFTALLLLLSRPVWSEETPAPQPKDNSVNRDLVRIAAVQISGYDKGRGGSVEDFIVKTAMFQSHVAMVAVNQAYGSGTMIGDPAEWPTPILARCPDKKESYIAATINLKAVRKTRDASRNFQQRRPDLYGEVVKTTTESPRPPSPPGGNE